MTRRVLGAAALVAAVTILTSQDVSAFGKRSKGGCAPVPSCETGGGACAPSHTVSYVDQVVTCMKPEWKTKKVEVDVVEHKWVDEKFKYWAHEQVTKKEKVKVCELKHTVEKFKYTVNEMVQVKDKVKVCEHVWTEKDEKYTYYEPVYGKTKVKKLVCETVCVPTEVTCVIAPPPPPPSCDGGRKGLFSRLCGKKKADCAPPCPEPCPAPCQVVTHTVMKPTVVTKEVEVEVTTCTMQKKEGTHKVRVCTQVWTDKDVMVWKCVPTEKTGERTVCTPVWVDKDVDVCHLVKVEKEGTHKVCKPYTVRKTIDQAYCEWVKHETTVKVPVYTPCAAPSPCTTGMTGGCGSPAPSCCN